MTAERPWNAHLSALGDPKRSFTSFDEANAFAAYLADRDLDEGVLHRHPTAYRCTEEPEHFHVGNFRSASFFAEQARREQA